MAGDAGRLTHLFENLFRNAVEHVGADVTVTVGGVPEDDGFYVENGGSGIQMERRESAFKHAVTTTE